MSSKITNVVGTINSAAASLAAQIHGVAELVERAGVDDIGAAMAHLETAIAQKTAYIAQQRAEMESRLSSLLEAFGSLTSDIDEGANPVIAPLPAPAAQEAPEVTEAPAAPATQDDTASAESAEKASTQPSRRELVHQEIREAIAADPAASNREIAKRCRTDHKVVGRVRSDMASAENVHRAACSPA